MVQLRRNGIHGQHLLIGVKTNLAPTDEQGPKSGKAPAIAEAFYKWFYQTYCRTLQIGRRPLSSLGKCLRASLL
ncbi:hypothetical protein J3R74_003875 [Puniceicoccus vermicola]